MSRNIRLLLEYDGAPFLGWQAQPQGPTVQSVLEEAVLRVAGERVVVIGSGRTDAGVHALGQVANFHTSSPLDAGGFRRALNAVLPQAVSVLRADEVPDDFHSRFSATGKTYRYRVFNRRERAPLEIGRSWHIRSALDIESTLHASMHLIGKKDFSSFRASGCTARHPVRDLRRCDVSRDGSIVSFELEADGFLRHMVRTIVGTLVDVGTGKISTGDAERILAACDRTQAGRTAPADGLYLVSVDYPERFRTTATGEGAGGAPLGETPRSPQRGPGMGGSGAKPRSGTRRGIDNSVRNKENSPSERQEDVGA